MAALEHKKSYAGKGRLLKRVVSLTNCVPFQNGDFLRVKVFAPSWSYFFPLRAVHHLNQTLSHFCICTIFHYARA